MDRKQIDELLQASLDDRRMSRGEKRTLRDLMAAHFDKDHDRDWLRSRVFTIARESLVGPEAMQTVEWLQDAAALLVQAERRSQPDSGQQPDEVLFSPGQFCRLQIQESLRAARTNVDICVFTITDDRITTAIQDAHDRGVRVRIISDNDKAGDIGNDAHRLRERGVPVLFDRTPHHMHHKFAIFDGRSVITGSYNWTRSAADDNHENIVVLNCPATVRPFQLEFDRLWKEFS